MIRKYLLICGRFADSVIIMLPFEQKLLQNRIKCLSNLYKFKNGNKDLTFKDSTTKIV